MPGRLITRPNSAAVPTARWIGSLNSVSVITENVPPPIPIMLEKQPMAVGIAITHGARGTLSVRLRLSARNVIFIATNSASVANTPARTRLWTCAAIQAPSSAPSSTKTAQRLTISMFTAPRR